MSEVKRTDEQHIGLKISDLKKLNEDVEDNLIKTLGNYDKAQTYILVLEGCSSSGKSTFGEILQEKFIKSDIATDLIRMDDYLRWKYNGVDDPIHHNFDDPCNYLFNEVSNTLKLLLEGKPAPKWIRCSKEGAKKLETNHQQNPHIIIIEGVMASNVFKKEIYNHLSFDGRIELNEEALKNKKYWIKNEAYDLINEKAKVFKIYFDLCPDAMLEIRRKRDFNNEIDKNSEFTIENLKQALEKVQYRILRWVIRSTFFMIDKDNKKDVVLHHGSFNELGFYALFNNILKYFEVKDYDINHKIPNKIFIDKGKFNNCNCYTTTPTLLEQHKLPPFDKIYFEKHSMSQEDIKDLFKKTKYSGFRVLYKFKKAIPFVALSLLVSFTMFLYPFVPKVNEIANSI